MRPAGLFWRDEMRRYTTPTHTIIVSGDLMEGLDKELDDFFKDLMK